MLCGRKIHKWGREIGLSRGILNNLNKGKLPNADKLWPIVRAENLSITWLLEGRGSRYLVNHCLSDEDCYEQLSAFYEEAWTTYVLFDGFGVSLVLTQPGAYEIDGVTYLYTVMEVITGPVGRETLSLVAERNNGENTFFLKTATTTTRRLAKGELGPFDLVYSEEALLKEAVLLPKNEKMSIDVAQNVAENSIEYKGGGKITADEMATIEDLRRLNQKHLAQMKAVIHSLADEAGKQTSEK